MATTATADIDLMAHLMRRAGFGATREEIEENLDLGYENVVERLLHPSGRPRHYRRVHGAALPRGPVGAPSARRRRSELDVSDDNDGPSA